MQGIEVLLGAEVWPWIAHTLTLGVIAGGVCAFGRVAFQKWRELPLVEHRVVNTIDEGGKVTEIAITVIVFNRSPATMLRFEGLVIKKPTDGVLFGARNDQRGVAYYCGKDIAPLSPAATRYPSASGRAVISDWPQSGAKVNIRVWISPRSAWMIFSKRTISIKLPKTV